MAVVNDCGIMCAGCKNKDVFSGKSFLSRYLKVAFIFTSAHCLEKVTRKIPGFGQRHMQLANFKSSSKTFHCSGIFLCFFFYSYALCVFSDDCQKQMLAFYLIEYSYLKLNIYNAWQSAMEEEKKHASIGTSCRLFSLQSYASVTHKMAVFLITDCIALFCYYHKKYSRGKGELHKLFYLKPCNLNVYKNI